MEKSYKHRPVRKTQENGAPAQQSVAVTVSPVGSDIELISSAPALPVGSAIGLISQVSDRSLPARLKRRLGEVAGDHAVDYLAAVVSGRDPKPSRTRVDAARTVLDRVGVGTPRYAAPGDDETDLSAMSAAQLRAFVARGLGELALRAKPAEVPPDPKPQPIDIFD